MRKMALILLFIPCWLLADQSVHVSGPVHLADGTAVKASFDSPQPVQLQSSSTDPVHVVLDFYPPIQFRYSADGLNWHTTYEDGDPYQETSTDGGVSWTDAIRIKGDQGDPGPGVLSGGTTNQVLRKISNTDFDTQWHTPVKADVDLGNVPNVDATNPANIVQDATHRFVTDVDTAAWTSKQDALGYVPAHSTTTVNGHALTDDVVVTSTDVGLGNVTNDSQVKRSEMGAASGVATLSASSKLVQYPDGAAPGYFTPANPTALTSNSFLMFGLGSTITITPSKSGNIRFAISCFGSGVGTNGTNSLKISYGTGAAPANGAAATGTIIGGTYSSGSIASVAGTPSPIVRNVIITGLSAGTAYWFDVQGAKYSSNTSVSINTIEATLEELPY